jgi:hypothetical protein
MHNNNCVSIIAVCTYGYSVHAGLKNYMLILGIRTAIGYYTSRITFNVCEKYANKASWYFDSNGVSEK